MTDAEYRKHKARLQRLAKHWIHPLGLGFWKIDLTYDREGFRDGDRGEGRHCVAKAVTAWQYLSASIEFDMVEVAKITDEQLEDAFVHELMHIFLAELGANCTVKDQAIIATDHEERVCQMLTNAFFWSAGKMGARKRQRR